MINMDSQLEAGNGQRVVRLIRKGCSHRQITIGMDMMLSYMIISITSTNHPMVGKTFTSSPLDSTSHHKPTIRPCSKRYAHHKEWLTLQWIYKTDHKLIRWIENTSNNRCIKKNKINSHSIFNIRTILILHRSKVRRDQCLSMKIRSSKTLILNLRSWNIGFQMLNKRKKKMIKGWLISLIIL